ncbi:RepB plasmid partitioning protein [Breoghania corrubedonensis]|uniref:RepB plasmid partitioning protein n=1 Tax=Breoghania corrubedonensis TaxID=665038 RepID=A0A2T5VD36_9HYPH|nr:plasmid partitioning protein RepB C-terminal domain-containing protein [Breoghania corrubedonensis]PTW61679.1 RepB plasmid partitioning protein [Breoghania corrubedonensis]
MSDDKKKGVGVRLGFERDIVLLKLDQIIPLKSLRSGAKDSRKYAQILSSVRAIGLVEPPVVTHDTKNKGMYFLLDGLLRVESLRDMGLDKVECLISTDDEAYTYNKRINRLSAVQEHRMIVRAMDRGVPAEKIAEALELDVSTIRRRFRMLDGICAEAVQLLKETNCPMKTFELMRQMAPIRQVEAADLMVGQNNYSTMFAQALLAATPESQLIDPRKKKPTRGNPVTSEQMARMERELASLQSQVKSVEESYGIDNLHLTVAKGYIAKMLSNPHIVHWLKQNRHEYLSEFQSVAEIDSIA